MYAGRVAEEAGALELFRAPRHPYTRGLLASRPRLFDGRAGGVPAIAGSVPDLASRRRGRCAFAPRCPERFEPCDVREPALYATDTGLARCFLYERDMEHGTRSTEGRT
jgi:peptide/nickel transport system ATP-binding protein